MKELKLVLKRKWFDMIASGEKKEEYRELSAYWMRRLCAQSRHEDGGRCEMDCLMCSKLFYLAKPFDAVTFYLGYAKNRPSMTFKIERITIGQGWYKWGAEPGKEYFVIELGERL